jgi:hypothetical protein
LTTCVLLFVVDNSQETRNTLKTQTMVYTWFSLCDKTIWTVNRCESVKKNKKKTKTVHNGKTTW